MPVNFPVAKGEVRLHGLMVDIDEESGRAISVQRIAETYRPAALESPATTNREEHTVGSIEGARS
jgi:hypothetical protein